MKKSRFTECQVCHQPGERYNPPGDEFWSHLKHPEDNHDFKPVSDLPTKDEVIEAINEAWCMAQDENIEPTAELFAEVFFRLVSGD